MSNRVYFGSYSLEHWLKLLRIGDIILPKYQRHFVWDKERMSKLVDSVREELFIPPITIGSFQENNKLQNLIIDGQQRLTSILLAHLGLFPDKEHYRRTDESALAAEDAGLENEDMEEEENTVIKWNVAELLGDDNSFEAIKERALRNGHYETFEPLIDDEMLKNRFLGFNYLVPSSKDPVVMQKYFSSVFRSVNYSGVNLLPQESRKALYYLDKSYEQYFAPDFCERITVVSKLAKGKVIMDFTRTLALLSVFHASGGYYYKVGRGYGRRMEVYYEMFIQSVVSDEYQETFGRFGRLFPNKRYLPYIDRLQQTAEALGWLRHYESIIDLDVYFMGLTYLILFKKKEIDTGRRDEIAEELEKTIKGFKDDYKHRRSPASLKYMQARMQQSIEIYEGYVQE